jgi:hypothetical protein
MAQCPYSEYIIDATERNSAGWGIRKSTGRSLQRELIITISIERM